jgi:hypothetical protein
MVCACAKPAGEREINSASPARVQDIFIGSPRYKVE